jgi:hypothetical protein
MQLLNKFTGFGHWASWLWNGCLVAPACVAAVYLFDHMPDTITSERLLLALAAVSIFDFLLLCLLDGMHQTLSRLSVPALLSLMGGLMIALTAAAIEKALRGLVDLGWTVPFILLAIAINVLAAFLERRPELKMLFCLQVNILALLAVFCWTDHLRLPI